MSKEILDLLRKDLVLLIEDYQCLWLEDSSLEDVEYIYTGLDRAGEGESNDEEEEEDEEYQFHFNSFEGSFDGTIYTWVHEYLKSRNLYKTILSDKLLALANESSGPFRPTMDMPASDDCYSEAEDVQNQIEQLENEAILIIAIVADELEITCKARNYFSDYGMEDFIKRMSKESEDRKIINRILSGED